MARNTDEHVKEKRRRAVASLIARDATLTVRQLAELLADQGERTPEGEAWHYSTISRDLKALHRQWLAASTTELTTSRTPSGTYLELLRALWAEKDHAGVRQTMKDLTSFLHLDAPPVIVHQHLELELNLIFDRLEAAFPDEPHIIDRIYEAVARSSSDELPELN